MRESEEFFSVSIRGESHIRNGKPMQDYSLAIKQDNLCIGVVCDGHGNDKHFRSEIGSMLAAGVARDRLLEFSSAYKNWDSVKEGLDDKLKRLGISIIASWQTSIEAHAKENPFTEEELKKAGSTFANRKDFDIASPYGTTLLAAMICNDYYLLIMIGDGAIVKIKPDFSCETIEFEGKKVFDDQPHSVTDSLCESDCHKKLFFKCEKTAPEEGIAFALCTDGLSEAFYSDEYLFKILKNCINYLAEEGLEKTKEAFSNQFQELSKRSPMKDDISLALVTNALQMYDKRNLEANNGQ